MKRTFLIIFYFCFLLKTSSGDNHYLNKEQLYQVANNISTEEVLLYVDEMTHPKYKGRLAGSPEYMDVAYWAAGLFREWGVEPALEDGSYFQLFPQPWSEVKTPGEFNITVNGQQREYSAPDDYYPGSNSYNGRVEGELVFTGYGITAPELNYDDYKNINVKGKIVVVAPGNPYKGKDPELSTLWGKYSSGRSKIQNAIEHGAIGFIYMDKLASPGSPYSKGFIYVHAGEKPVDDIFNSQGMNYKEVLSAIDEQMQPNSFNLNAKAELKAETVYHPEGYTANVVGIVPGNDPELKEELIIMGAHLDGQGYLGLFFPGALDNASGSANVLAAARAIASLKGKLKRSVMFILFGAEETGLVGSEYYCLNPVAPPEKTVLFMNLDMVGNGKGLAVWGAESFPELQLHFSWANDNYINRNMRFSPFRFPSGRPRTDGAMFSLHGFRTFHLGTTERINPLYYHDPRDTADLLVPDIMRDAARLLFLSSVVIANDQNMDINQMPGVFEFRQK